MLSGEATNTNFIVFGLTQSGHEPMIYQTRGVHYNHYTTNSVAMDFVLILRYELTQKMNSSTLMVVFTLVYLNNGLFMVFCNTFNNISVIL